jgi:hypothetical protein
MQCRATDEVFVSLQAKDHGDRWKPYECSSSENLVLPFMPRWFFKIRWMILSSNPLAMRFSPWQFSVGELLAFLAISGQLLWICIAWAANIGGMRYDVGATGPPLFHINCFLLRLIMEPYRNPAFIRFRGLGML